MHYASFVETYADLADAGFWRRANRERSIENWRTMLSTGVEAMLAEADGSIVGVAITAPAVPRGKVAPLRGLELTNLYVLARHQGSGIGQDLLDAVLPAVHAAQWSCAATRGRCATAQRLHRRRGGGRRISLRQHRRAAHGALNRRRCPQALSPRMLTSAAPGRSAARPAHGRRRAAGRRRSGRPPDRTPPPRSRPRVCTARRRRAPGEVHPVRGAPIQDHRPSASTSTSSGRPPPRRSGAPCAAGCADRVPCTRGLHGVSTTGSTAVATAPRSTVRTASGTIGCWAARGRRRRPARGGACGAEVMAERHGSVGVWSA